jgi:hypothetical protein
MMTAVGNHSVEHAPHPLQHHPKKNPMRIRFLHARMLRSSATLFAGLTIAWFGGTDAARAVIQVLIPLQALIADSDHIFVAKVERIDPAKPAAVFVATQAIKGELPLERMPVNLTGDKEKHTPQLLQRLAPDLPLIMCLKKQDQGKQMVLAFSNGTWFQVLGQSDGPQTRWAFTHCETYLRRTFKGSTTELEQIVRDALSGKQKPPPPNPKEPPGFGPPVAAEPAGN